MTKKFRARRRLQRRRQEEEEGNAARLDSSVDSSSPPRAPTPPATLSGNNVRENGSVTHAPPPTTNGDDAELKLKTSSASRRTKWEAVDDLGFESTAAQRMLRQRPPNRPERRGGGARGGGTARRLGGYKSDIDQQRVGGMRAGVPTPLSAPRSTTPIKSTYDETTDGYYYTKGSTIGWRLRAFEETCRQSLAGAPPVMAPHPAYAPASFGLMPFMAGQHANSALWSPMIMQYAAPQHNFRARDNQRGGRRNNMPRDVKAARGNNVADGGEAGKDDGDGGKRASEGHSFNSAGVDYWSKDGRKRQQTNANVGHGAANNGGRGGGAYARQRGGLVPRVYPTTKNPQQVLRYMIGTQGEVVVRDLLDVAPIGGRNHEVDEDIDDNFDYMDLFESQYSQFLGTSCAPFAATPLMTPAGLMTPADALSRPVSAVPAQAPPPPQAQADHNDDAQSHHRASAMSTGHTSAHSSSSNNSTQSRTPVTPGSPPEPVDAPHAKPAAADDAKAARVPCE